LIPVSRSLYPRSCAKGDRNETETHCPRGRFSCFHPVNGGSSGAIETIVPFDENIMLQHGLLFRRSLLDAGMPLLHREIAF
jgi:hypothetical protein